MFKEKLRAQWILILACGMIFLAWFEPVKKAFPHDFAQEAEKFSEIASAFQIDKTLLVFLKAPVGKDVFNKDVLLLNASLTRSLQELDDIQTVMSLTNTLLSRKKKKTLVVSRLFPSNPKSFTQKEADRIRKLALSDPLIRGNFYSKNQQASMFILFLKEKSPPPTFFKKLNQVIEVYQKKNPKYTFGIQGLPAMGAFVLPHLKKELWWLLPLFLFFLALSLLVGCPKKRFGSSLLLLGLASVLSLGLLFLIFGSLSIGFLIVPVVCFWLILGWALALENEPERADVRRKFMRNIGFLGVLLGASFYGSGWPLLRQLGSALCFSSFFSTLLTYFVWGDFERMQSDVDDPNGISALTPGLFSWISLQTLVGKMIFVFFGAFLVWGMMQVQIVRSPSEYLPSQLALRKGGDLLERHFGGSIPVQIRIKGKLKNPHALKMIERMGMRLNAIPGLAQSQSISVVLRQLNRLMNQFARIPDTKRQVQVLWSFVDRQPALKSLLRDDGRDALLQTRLQIQRPVLPTLMLEQIASVIEDLPLHVKAVKWSTLSKRERKVLLEKRADWILEGTKLWFLQRVKAVSRKWTNESSWSERTSGLIRGLIVQDLKQSRQEASGYRFPIKALRIMLSRYLSSEACDLTIQKAQQEKIIKTFLKLNKQKDFAQASVLKKGIQQALGGEKTENTEEDLRYAVKTLLSKLSRLQSTLRMEELQAKVLKRLRYLYRSLVLNGSSPKGSFSELDKNELYGILAESENPQWYREVRSNSLSVSLSGLHGILFKASSEGLEQLRRITLGMAVFALLLCFFWFRTAGTVGRILAVPILVLMTQFAFLGWFKIPFEPILGIAMILGFWLSFFSALQLAQIRERYFLAKASEDPRFDLIIVVAKRNFRHAFLFAFPLLALCFSSFPSIREVSIIMILSLLLAPLWSWLFHQPPLQG